MQKKLPNPVVVEEIQTDFANRIKEIQYRVKKHGIREDAGDDCVAWILVTMIRRAGGYDPSIATVEAYVFGSLKWLCREYKKSKTGAGNELWRHPDAGKVVPLENSAAVARTISDPSPQPDASCAENDSYRVLWEFMNRKLTPREINLLVLADIDEEYRLDIAMRLDPPVLPNTERILEEVSKRVHEGPDTAANYRSIAVSLGKLGINLSKTETMKSLVNRIGKIGDHAEKERLDKMLEGLPINDVTVHRLASRMGDEASYDVCADALFQAGFIPRAGESPKDLAIRIHRSLVNVPAASELFVELQHIAVSQNIGQMLCRLHQRLRRLLQEITGVVIDIQRRGTQRGTCAIEEPDEEDDGSFDSPEGAGPDVDEPGGCDDGPDSGNDDGASDKGNEEPPADAP